MNQAPVSLETFDTSQKIVSSTKNIQSNTSKTNMSETEERCFDVVENLCGTNVVIGKLIVNPNNPQIISYTEERKDPQTRVSNTMTPRILTNSKFLEMNSGNKKNVLQVSLIVCFRTSTTTLETNSTLP